LSLPLRHRLDPPPQLVVDALQIVPPSTRIYQRAETCGRTSLRQDNDFDARVFARNHVLELGLRRADLGAERVGGRRFREGLDVAGLRMERGIG
jgi:hypothetical protein